MELYKEILIAHLENQNITVTFDNLNINTTEIINLKSYETIKKIKAIIEDDSLDDIQCFEKIEEIITEFENIGSDGGFRHDF